MLAVVGRNAGPNKEKPSEVVRGQASRLPWAWDGLCFAAPFLDNGTTDGLRDIVTNVVPTYSLGATWVRDNRGNSAVKFAGPADMWHYVEWPDHPVHDRPSIALTAYIRMKSAGIGETEGGIFCNWHTAGPPWCTWSIQSAPSDGNNLYAVLTLDGTDHNGAETAAIPTTEYVSAFLRWRDGEAFTFDVLGERGNTLFTSTYGSTLSGTISYAANRGIRLNATESPTNNFWGIYSQALLWNRKLSEPEMAALVADPFGWYSPRRETTAVASPFPVFGLAGAGMLYVGPGG